MNEKLKEFAAQAGFNLSGDYHCDEYELERFAELVRADERIPPVAWVVGLALLGAVFGLVPFMAWVMQ